MVLPGRSTRAFGTSTAGRWCAGTRPRPAPRGLGAQTLAELASPVHARAHARGSCRDGAPFFDALAAHRESAARSPEITDERVY